MKVEGQFFRLPPSLLSPFTERPPLVAGRVISSVQEFSSRRILRLTRRMIPRNVFADGAPATYDHNGEIAMRLNPVVFAVVLLMAVTPFGQAAAVWTTIDPPGSINTQASGINTAGQIVGGFFDAH